MTTTRLVPLKNLMLEVDGWKNPRLFTGLSDKELADLAESIKATTSPTGVKGPIDPPKVQQIVDADGQIINLTVDGQRRVRASLLAFTKNHEIEVVDISDPQPLTPELADKLTDIALTTGNNREGYSSFELSETAAILRDRGKTLETIARSIHRSESWVSKILTARTKATPRLMNDWRHGRVTDEQFKELAAVEGRDQVEKTKQVVAARASGDKSEARAASKEAKALVSKKPPKRDSEVELERRPDKKAEKADAAANKANGKAKESPTAWEAPPPVRPTKNALEQLVGLTSHRVPTDPYVKGIIDGVRYALDETALHAFGAPWAKYMARVAGESATAPKKDKAKKAPRKAKPAKVKAKAEGKKSRKAKPKKAGKARKKAK